jgi:hypothetical protein
MVIVAFVDLFAATVLVEDREHPLSLSLSEAVKAFIVRVVHVVVDVVETGLIRARVSFCGTSLGGSALSRSIRDVVTFAGA